jgi:hypothetical protein
MSTNSDVVQSPTIGTGPFTSFVISPTADNMCDLYNSFIDAEIKVTVKNNESIPANVYRTTTTEGDEELPGYFPDLGAYTRNTWPDNPRRVWVGYKDSMDAIESYQIIVNGQSVYTQNYAIE